MHIRKAFGRKKTGCRWKNNSQTYLCLQRWSTRSLSYSGLLIFRGKKAKFRGIFWGKFAEKSADFAGKKSKFAEKSADFAGFSREKSQNSQKNRPISRDLAEKSQISKDFQGQILRKIGRFHWKFWGETSPRNNEKKTADFFWQISLKSINFSSIWPALFNVFFNRDNHLLFQKQFARERNEC